MHGLSDTEQTQKHSYFTTTQAIAFVILALLVGLMTFALSNDLTKYTTSTPKVVTKPLSSPDITPAQKSFLSAVDIKETDDTVLVMPKSKQVKVFASEGDEVIIKIPKNTS